MRWLMMLAVLTACGSGEDPRDCFVVYSGEVADGLLGAGGEQAGMALAVDSQADLGETLDVEDAYLSGLVFNSGPQDCTFAVYLGDTLPDGSAVPDIDGTADAPDPVDGLGALVFSEVLSGSAPGTDSTAWDEVDFDIAVPVDAASWVTMVGCTNGALTAQSFVSTGICTTDGDAVPASVDVLSQAW